MKLASLIGLLGTAALVLFLHTHAPAQSAKDGKDKPAEVNVVLRISRKFIEELTTKKIRRSDPVYLCVLDSEIVGEAWTDATFSMQFDVNTKESAFFLLLKGRTTSRTMSERSWVKVHGSAVMDFTVRKRVTFDGVKYHGDPAEVDASFRSWVDDIATPGGLVGWIIKLIATKEVRRNQPVVAQVAFEDGKTKLTEDFDKETTRLIDDLNQVSPLQETIRTLYPETQDWISYLSTTPTHLIVGVGPRDRRVPDLPVTEKTNAPIEMWLRSKKETQAMLRVFQLWKDAGKQLDSMLPPEIAKVVKPGEGFKTQFVKEWVVIQLGLGATVERKESAIARKPLVVWRAIAPGKGALPLAEPTAPLLPPAQPTAPSSSAPISWRPAGSAPKATSGGGEAGGAPTQVDWRPSQLAPARK